VFFYFYMIKYLKIYQAQYRNIYTDSKFSHIL